MLDEIVRRLGEARARVTPIQTTIIKAYLEKISVTGIDRVSLKVRNLAVPFHFAGITDKHLYLINADTCLLSQFHIDDLEPMFIHDLEAIQRQVFEWLDSTEYANVKPLHLGVELIVQHGTKVHAIVRWPEGGYSKPGLLAGRSFAHPESGGAWICAVETAEGKNAVFRYGSTRMERTVEEGKTLGVILKSGVPY